MNVGAGPAIDQRRHRLRPRAGCQATDRARRGGGSRACSSWSSRRACRVDGSKAPPPQLAPPITPGRMTVPLQRRRRVERPEPILRQLGARRDRATPASDRTRRRARRPARRTPAACVGNGCVCHACSPATSLAATGRSSIGQTGSPVTRSKTKANPCLVSCTTASIRRPLDGDRRQHRRGGQVVVPQAVMDDLEVPLPLPGQRVETDDRFGEQIRAGPPRAVVVVARRADRQIQQAARLVERHRRPDVGVAGELPRLVLPGLVAELARARNRAGTSTPAFRSARRTRARRRADRCDTPADRRRRCRG